MFFKKIKYKKKYKLIYNEGYYILIKNNKQIFNSISFISMYDYIKEKKIDFCSVYLLPMSLYDFFRDWASFDDDRIGGTRI